MIEILFGFHFSIIISRVENLLRRKKTILNIKSAFLLLEDLVGRILVPVNVAYI